MDTLTKSRLGPWVIITAEPPSSPATLANPSSPAGGAALHSSPPPPLRPCLCATITTRLPVPPTKSPPPQLLPYARGATRILLRRRATIIIGLFFLSKFIKVLEDH
ncbi:hypothetical protein PIB30_031775 [Stylosanthes scabra]|uniref:Uncharacterized protein n=1 Tax=Stylosanthes scabra TaxID=79078 RepID=A0ABU6XDG7_9FABA|nr:hypothetical protein [Stylosanthes scabra]